MMKPFKFLRNNRNNPIVFNLNVMSNNPSEYYGIYGYVVYIEPYELEHTDECTGSIRDMITGVVQLPTQIFNGVLLKRVDGEYVEINHNNVREVNDENLIFDINDRITLRYRDMQYETI